MNIEKQIIEAMEKQKLEIVALCQSYKECGLVKYKQLIYYFPNLTEEQRSKSTSFICKKHKEEIYGK